MSIHRTEEVTRTHKTTRWMITGEWSGPSNPAGGYTRFQHLEYTRDSKRADWCDGNSIRFSDGTMLFLAVEPMGHGERRQRPEKNGYGKLISDCVRHDVNTVDELCARQSEARS